MDIARKIHNLLIKNKQTLSVAESCTGGLLCEMLTHLSGSSKYFLLGAVTYSNNSKIKILKIPRRIILKEGAVSAKVAHLMAKNIRKIAHADFGIGISGIAGPKGATKGKSIGTVFIATASKSKAIVKRFKFNGNRSCIRTKSAKATLELLKEMLK